MANIVDPFVPYKARFNGVSFGLSSAGYDIRIAQDVILFPGRRFILASTIEKFNMPVDIIGIVHDKSTWARRGVAVQNTVIEPGWRGYLTLEITLHRMNFVRIKRGAGIAQIIFHRIDNNVINPYEGKYQDQKYGPVKAIKSM
jgi:dCTP deaminase